MPGAASASVCSTRMMESAPGGTGAPVMMRTAWPGPRAALGVAPARGRLAACGVAGYAAAMPKAGAVRAGETRGTVRVAALDGLRGLAALAVLWGHAEGALRKPFSVRQVIDAIEAAHAVVS